MIKRAWIDKILFIIARDENNMGNFMLKELQNQIAKNIKDFNIFSENDLPIEMTINLFKVGIKVFELFCSQ